MADLFWISGARNGLSFNVQALNTNHRMSLPPVLLSTGLLEFKNSLYLVWLLWPFSKSAVSVLCSRPVSTGCLKGAAFQWKSLHVQIQRFQQAPRWEDQKETRNLGSKRKTILFLFFPSSPHVILCKMLLWRSPSATAPPITDFCLLLKVSQTPCLTLCSVPVS